jgi:hypothetical protein
MVQEEREETRPAHEGAGIMRILERLKKTVGMCREWEVTRPTQRCAGGGKTQGRLEDAQGLGVRQTGSRRRRKREDTRPAREGAWSGRTLDHDEKTQGDGGPQADSRMRREWGYTRPTQEDAGRGCTPDQLLTPDQLQKTLGERTPGQLGKAQGDGGRQANSGRRRWKDTCRLEKAQEEGGHQADSIRHMELEDTRPTRVQTAESERTPGEDGKAQGVGSH